jgi:hypothetical protein
MISMDKKYKTRDGREVKIYSVEGNAYDHVHGAILDCVSRKWLSYTWCKDGKLISGYDNTLDLVEVKERKKFERWINVYPDGTTAIHLTKETADKNRAKHVFACVKITIECEEGEGL